VKQSAKALHDKYEILNFISYQDIDATNIPYEEHFDIIIFKSIIGGIAKIGGIDMQKKVFNEIYKALKPGGMLLFAENLVASPIHQYARKKFNKWGDYWRYLSIDETKSFLANFQSLSYDTTGFSAAFGRTEGQRNILAKLDQMLLNHISPKSWKYVIYGVAVK
jgi:SAM-dependent methyltransferase